MLLSESIESARRVIDEVIAPRAEQVDREGRWPEEGLRALLAAGLGGLVVPEAAGGMGLGLEALAVLCEEIGRACASTAICFGMHCVATAVIAAKATQDQRERFLEPIARGEHLTTLALSEPGTGSHFYIPETRLERRSSDLFVVDGVKVFVTNGGHADSYVISTLASDAATAPGSFSCLVIPRDAPGLRWQGSWEGWGMRGNCAITAILDGAQVGARNLLGTEGDEVWYVFNVVAPYFLVAMAGTYVGVAAAAFDEAKATLGHRIHSHSGQALTTNPILQHRLGALWGALEQTRCLVREAARKGDRGADDALPALCAAKAEVADCVDRVVAGCMALMGGRAYAAKAKIHRHYRDGQAAHVMAPPTDLLRTWIGRAVLGLPLLGP